MSIKIIGLDKLQRELKDAEKALSSLYGTIETLQITPGDLASVHAAIREMESVVDSKVTSYRGNGVVEPLVKAAKEHYREEILKLARGHAQTYGEWSTAHPLLCIVSR
jgi:hypothetical protein